MWRLAVAYINGLSLEFVMALRRRRKSRVMISVVEAKWNSDVVAVGAAPDVERGV